MTTVSLKTSEISEFGDFWCIRENCDLRDFRYYAQNIENCDLRDSRYYAQNRKNYDLRDFGYYAQNIENCDLRVFGYFDKNRDCYDFRDCIQNIENRDLRYFGYYTQNIENCDFGNFIQNRESCDLRGFENFNKNRNYCDFRDCKQNIENCDFGDILNNRENRQFNSFIDIQWFASAEEEGRTEKPSEHKLKKAKEEGRVPKSQEISGALVLLLPLCCLIILAPWIFRNCVEVIQFYLSNSCTMELSNPAVYKVFLEYFLKSLLPIFACGIVAGIVGNVLQTKGFMFTTKAIAPKFNKLIPKFGEYFKRTLFSFEGLFNVVKSILKVVIIFIIAYSIIKNDLQKLLSLSNVGLWAAFTYVAGLVSKLLLIASLVFLVVSVPDYLVQRHQFMESMKMTKQEVKEEFKELEGDPYVKGRLRQYMNEMLSRNLAANVAKADVVITNPTHYAVAIEYDRETAQAPMVTAKGVDSVALRIKEIAKENDVPIRENRPLARELYAKVEVGDIIPTEFYQALAIILAGVYNMKK